MSVLYEPSTSISITDLKAFTEIWLIEARKLPAAPALDKRTTSASKQDTGCAVYNIHHEVDSSKFLYAAVHRGLETIERSHIHGTNANHLSTGASCGKILCNFLGLFNISANNAGVGT